MAYKSCKSLGLERKHDSSDSGLGRRDTIMPEQKWKRHTSIASRVHGIYEVNVFGAGEPNIILFPAVRFPRRWVISLPV